MPTTTPKWFVEYDHGAYYVACADYAIETVYETFDAARAKADELNKDDE